MPAIDNLHGVPLRAGGAAALEQEPRGRAVLHDLRLDAGRTPRRSSEITDFLEANRALAPYLVFEFSQFAVRAHGADRAGVPRDARRSRLPLLDGSCGRPAHRAARTRRARLPLHQGAGGAAAQPRGAPNGDIHPADFSDLLGRFGIDLIAEKIEGEGTVVDLLDYDVRFGQGFLFSPPRPVRAEVLQGFADRPSVAAPRSRAPAAARSAAGASARRMTRSRADARRASRACRCDRRRRDRALRAGSCAARRATCSTQG